MSNDESNNSRRQRRRLPRRHTPRNSSNTEEAIPDIQNEQIRYNSNIDISESINSWNELYNKTIKELFEKYENVNNMISTLEEPRDIAAYTLKSTEIGARLVDLLHKGHKTGVIDINDSENTELTQYDINEIVENAYSKLMLEMENLNSPSEKLTYLAQRDLLREELKKDIIDNHIFELLIRSKHEKNSHKLLTKIDNLRKLINTSSKRPAEILRLAEYAEMSEQSNKSNDILESIKEGSNNDDD